jgi:hypothetical protein
MGPVLPILLVDTTVVFQFDDKSAALMILLQKPGTQNNFIENEDYKPVNPQIKKLATTFLEHEILKEGTVLLGGLNAKHI